MPDELNTTPCRYACAGFPMCGCEVEALYPPTITEVGVIPEEAFKRFDADLARRQQPLGKTFSTVLLDNLWNLYVRS